MTRRTAILAPLVAIAALLTGGAPAAQALDSACSPRSPTRPTTRVVRRPDRCRRDGPDGIDDAGAITSTSTTASRTTAVAGQSAARDGGAIRVPDPLREPARDLGEGLRPGRRHGVCAAPVDIPNTATTPVTLQGFRWAQTDYATSDVLTSSSGDEAVTPADDWFPFDDAVDATDPASAFVWQGAVGRGARRSTALRAVLHPDAGPDRRRLRRAAVALRAARARARRDRDADAVPVRPPDRRRGARRRGRSPRTHPRPTRRCPTRRSARCATSCRRTPTATAWPTRPTLPERGQRRTGEPRRRRAGRRVRRGRRQRRSSRRVGSAVRDGPGEGRHRRRRQERRDGPLPAGGERAADRLPAFDTQQTVDIFRGRLDPASTAATLRARGRRFTVRGTVLRRRACPPSRRAERPASSSCVRAAAGVRRVRCGARLQLNCTFAVSLRARARKGQSVPPDGSVELGDWFLELAR